MQLYNYKHLEQKIKKIKLKNFENVVRNHIFDLLFNFERFTHSKNDYDFVINDYD